MRYRKGQAGRMKKITRFLCAILFVFLFVLPQDARAEEIVEVQNLDSVDVRDRFISKRTPEKVDFRIPSEDKIREFKKQKEFDYTEEPPKLNLLQRILNNIMHFFSRTVGKLSTSNALMYPVIIILVLLLLFIIFKLLKINPKRLLGKKKLQSIDDINIESENVHEMNFTELINKAIEAENYRLAVRYLYLKNLKKLSDKEYVVWSPNKTNTNYVQELKDENLKKNFFRTSLIFDYVWYGEMILDKNAFKIAKDELETFEKLLDNER